MLTYTNFSGIFISTTKQKAVARLLNRTTAPIKKYRKVVLF